MGKAADVFSLKWHVVALSARPLFRYYQFKHFGRFSSFAYIFHDSFVSFLFVHHLFRIHSTSSRYIHRIDDAAA